MAGCPNLTERVLSRIVGEEECADWLLHQLKAVLAARQAAPALQVIDAVTFQQSGNQGPVLMNQLIGKDNPLRW